MDVILFQYTLGMKSAYANCFFLLVIHLRQTFYLIMTFAHTEGRIPRKL
jgi:hypothetical protein